MQGYFAALANDECWQFETGGRQYPEHYVRVNVDYFRKRKGSEIDVLAGKCTFVASCLSFMWSPKNAAQLIACLRQYASLRW